MFALSRWILVLYANVLRRMQTKTQFRTFSHGNSAYQLIEIIEIWDWELWALSKHNGETERLFSETSIKYMRKWIHKMFVGNEHFWICRLYNWLNFEQFNINVVRGARIFVIIKIYGSFVAMQILCGQLHSFMENFFLWLGKYYFYSTRQEPLF